MCSFICKALQLVHMDLLRGIQFMNIAEGKMHTMMSLLCLYDLKVYSHSLIEHGSLNVLCWNDGNSIHNLEFCHLVKVEKTYTGNLNAIWKYTYYLGCA